MSQETKVIDLRRSYIPIDPNAFEATYHGTEREDSPEPRIPLIPYDGYNFMPTPQGYASFFGINVKLGIATLITSGGTGNVDDLFMIQTNAFANILIALCDDGIWSKAASSTGNWTHVITLAVPATGVHKLWSKCVLDNVVYTYRQGEANIWKAGPLNSYVFTGYVPTFLNMAGQLGIFKAGGRLGSWDSENSTGWSNLGDPTIFDPSPETLAGASIFQDIVGRIVNVLQHGTGFIIYATKSIVLVTRNTNLPSLFAGRALFNNNGISYREECCYAEPDTEHYAFTTQGLVEISGDEAKFVIPEIATYLKEKKDPIYLKMMNGRYLFMPILNPYYFTGLAKIHSEDFSDMFFTFKGASYAIDNYADNPIRAFGAMQSNQAGAYLFDTYGYQNKSQATTAGQVPIWEDHLKTIIPLATLETWKAYNASLFGTDQYFVGQFTAQGGIAKIDGSGTEYTIPQGMVLISGYAQQERVEDNTQSFYLKQEYLWFAEDKFQQDWEYALVHKVHNPITQAVTGPFTDTATLHTYGPYIDISAFSERNRYYGTSDKSAWLQRSLTKGIYVDIYEYVKGVAGVATAHDGTWGGNVMTYGGTLPASYPNYAAIPATVAATIQAAHGGDPGGPYTFDEPVPRATNYTTGVVTFVVNTRKAGAILFTSSPTYTSDGSGGTLAVVNKTQTFSIPVLRFVDYATCIYKELGYTKIKGHGHYDITGAFVVDNATPEAADYVDACIATPSKKKKPLFNGASAGTGSDPFFLYSPDSVVIHGITYTWPDEVVTIPGGTILLQDGSIEPIYPTYLGAFVYDTQYKKWGKMMQNYKQLLDYFPVNNVAGDRPLPYETFLPKMAMIGEDGLIALFDQYPLDSFITFGKFGQYRKGFTDLEEVKIQNRTPLSGSVTVEGSLDGKSIEYGLTSTFSYTNALSAGSGFNLSARLYNLTVEGNYDLVGLEVRSSRKGKR